MTNEAKQIFLSIAPLFVEKGIALQERVAAAGGDPDKCTVGGKPIIEAYAASAKEWAETFARVIKASNNPKTLEGRKIRVRYTLDGAPAVSEGIVHDVREGQMNMTYLFVGKVDFALTAAEIGELMDNGEVSLCDYYLTLVKE